MKRGKLSRFFRPGGQVTETRHLQAQLGGRIAFSLIPVASDSSKQRLGTGLCLPHGFFIRLRRL